MANIIVATEEQIQEAVFNAVSKFFSGNQQAISSSDLPDTLSRDSREIGLKLITN